LSQKLLLDESGGVDFIPTLVAKLQAHLNTHPIVLLKGNLGTGKTSFSKALLKELGYVDEVSSPTFNIVNTYTFEGKTVYHFDLYRIKRVEELEEIGFMDYLDSKHVCLIEWPEIVEEYIDLPHISMQLEHADGNRHYVVNLID
jgi:tRNA threonylcarbamoyladenosine biosynthesis protein TsaE